MSTLKTQVKQFQSQIKSSSNVHENETIIKASSDILNRLNKSLAELSRNKKKFNVMPLISELDAQLIPRIGKDKSDGFLIGESSGLTLGDDVKILLESAKESTSIFIEKWRELQYKAQQDDSLNNSIVALRNLTKAINDLNDKYWDQWLNHLENDFVVEEVVLEQQSSLGKKATYQKYNSLIASFDAKKVSKDVNSDLVSSLNSLKKQLVTLRGEMDTSDLPEGVAKFLKELDAPWSTPTLELLTPTVFEWLTKQGLLSKLKISR